MSAATAPSCACAAATCAASLGSVGGVDVLEGAPVDLRRVPRPRDRVARPDQHGSRDSACRDHLRGVQRERIARVDHADGGERGRGHPERSARIGHVGGGARGPCHPERSADGGARSLCHPERSEGSRCFGGWRSLAALGMTTRRGMTISRGMTRSSGLDQRLQAREVRRVAHAKVFAISAAAPLSIGTNSRARGSGSRAVAAWIATAAATVPSASRTGTATQATPSTYSSLSTA